MRLSAGINAGNFHIQGLHAYKKTLVVNKLGLCWEDLCVLGYLK